MILVIYNDDTTSYIFLPNPKQGLFIYLFIFHLHLLPWWFCHKMCVLSDWYYYVDRDVFV